MFLSTAIYWIAISNATLWTLGLVAMLFNKSSYQSKSKIAGLIIGALIPISIYGLIFFQ